MKRKPASLLLSACLFLSLLLLLLQGYLHVYERQMRTLQLAEENYQVKSLIALAQMRKAQGEDCDWYTFNLGRVHLDKTHARIKLKIRTKPIVKPIAE
ncbi:hypothetical protein MK904_11480 [Loigolactobacillus coryniformis]|jgi:hypothetical protein|uniref:competence type IV pilus minor pilin ComGG n=1 Tax=Loigolactobacillus coryniformis TaxID=1610 RepID=UPI0023410C65|nr:competence type IV pilus minor pilin ComGG [Loigolactobacillus coryniformis]MDC4186710.1 hypothetical protein [Loigolactobacillus coryniformis]